jgi:hypothetical protein
VRALLRTCRSVPGIKVVVLPYPVGRGGAGGDGVPVDKDLGSPDVAGEVPSVGAGLGEHLGAGLGVELRRLRRTEWSGRGSGRLAWRTRCRSCAPGIEQTCRVAGQELPAIPGDRGAVVLPAKAGHPQAGSHRCAGRGTARSAWGRGPARTGRSATPLRAGPWSRSR